MADRETRRLSAPLTHEVARMEALELLAIAEAERAASGKSRTLDEEVDDDARRRSATLVTNRLNEDEDDVQHNLHDAGGEKGETLVDDFKALRVRREALNREEISQREILENALKEIEQFRHQRQTQRRRRKPRSKKTTDRTRRRGNLTTTDEDVVEEDDEEDEDIEATNGNVDAQRNPPHEEQMPTSAFLVMASIEMQLSTLRHFLVADSSRNGDDDATPTPKQHERDATLLSSICVSLQSLLESIPVGGLRSLRDWEFDVLGRISTTLESLVSPLLESQRQQPLSASFLTLANNMQSLLLSLAVHRGSLRMVLRALDRALLPVGESPSTTTMLASRTVMPTIASRLISRIEKLSSASSQIESVEDEDELPPTIIRLRHVLPPSRLEALSPTSPLAVSYDGAFVFLLVDGVIHKIGTGGDAGWDRSRGPTERGRVYAISPSRSSSTAASLSIITAVSTDGIQLLCAPWRRGDDDDDDDGDEEVWACYRLPGESHVRIDRFTALSLSPLPPLMMPHHDREESEREGLTVLSGACKSLVGGIVRSLEGDVELAPSTAASEKRRKSKRGVRGSFLADDEDPSSGDVSDHPTTTVAGAALEDDKGGATVCFCGPHEVNAEDGSCSFSNFLGEGRWYYEVEVMEETEMLLVGWMCENFAVGGAEHLRLGGGAEGCFMFDAGTGERLREDGRREPWGGVARCGDVIGCMASLTGGEAGEDMRAEFFFTLNGAPASVAQSGTPESDASAFREVVITGQRGVLPLISFVSRRTDRGGLRLNFGGARRFRLAPNWGASFASVFEGTRGFGALGINDNVSREDRARGKLALAPLSSRLVTIRRGGRGVVVVARIRKTLATKELNEEHDGETEEEEEEDSQGDGPKASVRVEEWEFSQDALVPRLQRTRYLDTGKGGVYPPGRWNLLMGADNTVFVDVRTVLAEASGRNSPDEGNDDDGSIAHFTLSPDGNRKIKLAHPMRDGVLYRGLTRVFNGVRSSRALVYDAATHSVWCLPPFPLHTSAALVRSSNVVLFPAVSLGAEDDSAGGEDGVALAAGVTEALARGVRPLFLSPPSLPLCAVPGTCASTSGHGRCGMCVFKLARSHPSSLLYFQREEKEEGIAALMSMLARVSPEGTKTSLASSSSARLTRALLELLLINVHQGDERSRGARATRPTRNDAELLVRLASRSTPSSPREDAGEIARLALAVMCEWAERLWPDDEARAGFLRSPPLVSARMRYRIAVTLSERIKDGRCRVRPSEAKRWLEDARRGDPAAALLTRACILALTHAVRSKPGLNYDVTIVNPSKGSPSRKLASSTTQPTEANVTHEVAGLPNPPVVASTSAVTSSWGQEEESKEEEDRGVESTSVTNANDGVRGLNNTNREEVDARRGKPRSVFIKSLSVSDESANPDLEGDRHAIAFLAACTSLSNPQSESRDDHKNEALALGVEACAAMCALLEGGGGRAARVLLREKVALESILSFAHDAVTVDSPSSSSAGSSAVHSKGEEEMRLVACEWKAIESGDIFLAELDTSRGETSADTLPSSPTVEIVRVRGPGEQGKEDVTEIVKTFTLLPWEMRRKKFSVRGEIVSPSSRATFYLPAKFEKMRTNSMEDHAARVGTQLLRALVAACWTCPSLAPLEERLLPWLQSSLFSGGLRLAAITNRWTPRNAPSEETQPQSLDHGVEEEEEEEEEEGEESDEHLRLLADLLSPAPPADSPAARLLEGLRLPHNRVLRDQGVMTERAARAVMAALLRLNGLEGEALAFARAAALTAIKPGESETLSQAGPTSNNRGLILIHAPTGIRAIWGMAQHARKWVDDHVANATARRHLEACGWGARGAHSRPVPDSKSREAKEEEDEENEEEDAYEARERREEMDYRDLCALLAERAECVALFLNPPLARPSHNPAAARWQRVRAYLCPLTCRMLYLRPEYCVARAARAEAELLRAAKLKTRAARRARRVQEVGPTTTIPRRRAAYTNVRAIGMVPGEGGKSLKTLTSSPDLRGGAKTFFASTSSSSSPSHARKNENDDKHEVGSSPRAVDVDNSNRASDEETEANEGDTPDLHRLISSDDILLARPGRFPSPSIRPSSSRRGGGVFTSSTSSDGYDMPSMSAADSPSPASSVRLLSPPRRAMRPPPSNSNALHQNASAATSTTAIATSSFPIPSLPPRTRRRSSITSLIARGSYSNLLASAASELEETLSALSATGATQPGATGGERRGTSMTVSSLRSASSFSLSRAFMSKVSSVSSLSLGNGWTGAGVEISAEGLPVTTVASAALGAWGMGGTRRRSLGGDFEMADLLVENDAASLTETLMLFLQSPSVVAPHALLGALHRRNVRARLRNLALEISRRVAEWTKGRLGRRQARDAFETAVNTVGKCLRGWEGFRTGRHGALTDDESDSRTRATHFLTDTAGCAATLRRALASGFTELLRTLQGQLSRVCALPGLPPRAAKHARMMLRCASQDYVQRDYGEVLVSSGFVEGGLRETMRAILKLDFSDPTSRAGWALLECLARRCLVECGDLIFLSRPSTARKRFFSSGREREDEEEDDERELFATISPSAHARGTVLPSPSRSLSISRPSGGRHELGPAIITEEDGEEDEEVVEVIVGGGIASSSSAVSPRATSSSASGVGVELEQDVGGKRAEEESPSNLLFGSIEGGHKDRGERAPNKIRGERAGDVVSPTPMTNPAGHALQQSIMDVLEMCLEEVCTPARTRRTPNKRKRDEDSSMTEWKWMELPGEGHPLMMSIEPLLSSPLSPAMEGSFKHLNFFVNLYCSKTTRFKPGAVLSFPLRRKSGWVMRPRTQDEGGEGNEEENEAPHASMVSFTNDVCFAASRLGAETLSPSNETQGVLEIGLEPSRAIYVVVVIYTSSLGTPSLVNARVLRLHRFTSTKHFVRRGETVELEIVVTPERIVLRSRRHGNEGEISKSAMDNEEVFDISRVATVPIADEDTEEEEEDGRSTSDSPRHYVTASLSSSPPSLASSPTTKHAHPRSRRSSSSLRSGTKLDVELADGTSTSFPTTTRRRSTPRGDNSKQRRFSIAEAPWTRVLELAGEVDVGRCFNAHVAEGVFVSRPTRTPRDDIVRCPPANAHLSQTLSLLTTTCEGSAVARARMSSPHVMENLLLPLSICPAVPLRSRLDAIRLVRRVGPHVWDDECANKMLDVALDFIAASMPSSSLEEERGLTRALLEEPTWVAGGVALEWVDALRALSAANGHFSRALARRVVKSLQQLHSRLASGVSLLACGLQEVHACLTLVGGEWNTLRVGGRARLVTSRRRRLQDGVIHLGGGGGEEHDGDSEEEEEEEREGERATRGEDAEGMEEEDEETAVDEATVRVCRVASEATATTPPPPGGPPPPSVVLEECTSLCRVESSLPERVAVDSHGNFSRAVTVITMRIGPAPTGDISTYNSEGDNEETLHGSRDDGLISIAEVSVRARVASNSPAASTISVRVGPSLDQLRAMNDVAAVGRGEERDGTRWITLLSRGAATRTGDLCLHLEVIEGGVTTTPSTAIEVLGVRVRCRRFVRPVEKGVSHLCYGERGNNPGAWTAARFVVDKETGGAEEVVDAEWLVPCSLEPVPRSLWLAIARENARIGVEHDPDEENDDEAEEDPANPEARSERGVLFGMREVCAEVERRLARTSRLERLKAAELRARLVKTIATAAKEPFLVAKLKTDEREERAAATKAARRRREGGKQGAVMTAVTSLLSRLQGLAVKQRTSVRSRTAIVMTKDEEEEDADASSPRGRDAGASMGWVPCGTRTEVVSEIFSFGLTVTNSSSSTLDAMSFERKLVTGAKEVVTCAAVLRVTTTAHGKATIISSFDPKSMTSWVLRLDRSAASSSTAPAASNAARDETDGETGDLGEDATLTDRFPGVYYGISIENRGGDRMRLVDARDGSIVGPSPRLVNAGSPMFALRFGDFVEMTVDKGWMYVSVNGRPRVKVFGGIEGRFLPCVASSSVATSNAAVKAMRFESVSTSSDASLMSPKGQVRVEALGGRIWSPTTSTSALETAAWSSSARTARSQVNSLAMLAHDETEEETESEGNREEVGEEILSGQGLDDDEKAPTDPVLAFEILMREERTRRGTEISRRRRLLAREKVYELSALAGASDSPSDGSRHEVVDGTHEDEEEDDEDFDGEEELTLADARVRGEASSRIPLESLLRVPALFRVTELPRSATEGEGRTQPSASAAPPHLRVDVSGGRGGGGGGGEWKNGNTEGGPRGKAEEMGIRAVLAQGALVSARIREDLLAELTRRYAKRAFEKIVSHRSSMVETVTDTERREAAPEEEDSEEEEQREVMTEELARIEEAMGGTMRRVRRRRDVGTDAGEFESVSAMFAREHLARFARNKLFALATNLMRVEREVAIAERGPVNE